MKDFPPEPIADERIPDDPIPEPTSTPTEPTLIFNPESLIDRFDLERLYAKQQPLEVELGSGDGSFLAGYAASRPASNFMGVERLLGRLRKLDRKGLRLGLTNLRLFRIEASYLVEYMLPRQSASAIHIYFPDPWPKRRHRKNRLVTEAFVESVARALQPGGMLYLRTDDADYFQQMIKFCGASPLFSEESTPADLAEHLTDFERSFHARGIATLSAAYRSLVAP
jgi:tRNA (guanine-N7-)-methyltransferase